jgi:predicted TIM-barrel fold metal-dependent hydrolase
MMNSWRTLVLIAVILAAVVFLFAWPQTATTRLAASLELALQKQQTSQEQRTPTIEEYQPKSTLVTKEHKIERAKFPFIDIHSHHWNPTPEHVQDLIKGMDSINLRVLVNLSGGTGEELRKTVTTMKGRYPDRFVVFANMSYDDVNTPGFGKRAAARLEQDVKNGAQGLKIFKNFGMELKYANGQRVHVDDPEFDPVFEKCAELKIETVSGTCAAAFGLSTLRNAHGGAQSFVCQASEDEFHCGAPGVSWKRFGAFGEIV